MNSFDIAILQPLLEHNCKVAVADAWRAYLLTVAPELADESNQTLAYELMPYRNIKDIYEELVKRTSMPGYFDAYLELLAEFNLTLGYHARALDQFSIGDYNISSACAMPFVELLYAYPRKDAAVGGLQMLSCFCNMVDLYGNGSNFHDPKLLGDIHGVAANGEMEKTMARLARFLMLSPEATIYRA